MLDRDISSVIVVVETSFSIKNIIKYSIIEVFVILILVQAYCIVKVVLTPQKSSFQKLFADVRTVCLLASLLGKLLW